MAGDNVTTHALPPCGRVTIGRSADCGIAIDSDQVSRHHAAIEIRGERMWVEDLGSTHGTRARDLAVERGARVALAPGDAVELGAVMALLQYLPDVPPRSAASVVNPIVHHPTMTALYRVVDRLAAAALPVLLLGEPGVGKAVIAAQLHARSPRQHQPFVRVDCAHLDTALLVRARGGTVFLDEIAALPAELQPKLLGALDDARLDVRCVAATRVDLTEAIADARVRTDLYHRLAGATLVVPPLRARASEILPLARHFLERAAARHARAVPRLSAEAEARLAQYGWPGNVRELRDTLERAVLLAHGDLITCSHVRVGEVLTSDPERVRTLEALARCHGNQTRAARLLGIARSTFLKRLDAYGVPRPRKP